MDNVVGNVTSWFRRAVAGGSDEPNRSSSSTHLGESPPSDAAAAEGAAVEGGGAAAAGRGTQALLAGAAARAEPSAMGAEPTASSSEPPASRPGGVGRGGGGGGEGAPDTSNDKEIARLLQQELSLEEGGLSHLPSAPPVGSNNSSSSSSGGVGSAGAGRAAGGGQQHPVWSALVPAVCAGCNGPLGFSPALSSMGGLWHPHCFTCHACKQTISEKQFNIKDGKPYHAACHRQLFHPKCTVCQDFIRPNPAGMINFRSHPFWGDKWCPAHMTDSTPSCTSCSRLQAVFESTQNCIPSSLLLVLLPCCLPWLGLQSRGSPPFIDLPDGRHLCLDCVDSAVLDSADCRPLFSSVSAFFAQLGMPVRQQIPVLAVEQQALNDAQRAEREVRGCDGDASETAHPVMAVEQPALNEAQRAEREGHEHGSLTRGLCLSEEQTIQMVVRLPGSLTHASSFSAVGQQTMTVSRHCAVTAILVLYGLPRVLTASILAHELMHAWFKLDGGFRHLPPELEEGMCQVMAYLWLQTQAPPAPHAPSQAPSQQASSAAPLAHEAHSSFQQRFAAFCLHSIATDASPVYGDGFRAAHAAVLKHGLLPTLEHIRAYRALPRV
ncbi:unnamed protein product [Closterium sp. NIES-65]|nr:unnamed protein product [Closterium sp. NIES-65]